MTNTEPADLEELLEDADDYATALDYAGRSEGVRLIRGLIAEVRRLQEICTRALAAANRVDVADYEFDSASIVDVERILKETR